MHLEALRRLPGDVYDKHVFRVVRASQLEINKQFLPKEQWPSYEEVCFDYAFLSWLILPFVYSIQDETTGKFLRPYIEEVLKEKKEKEEWVSFLSKD